MRRAGPVILVVAVAALPWLAVKYTPLAAVLAGTAPDAVFEDPEAFRDALEEARAGPRSWQPAPERLRVRRVTWEGVDATLVG
jgi:hypothetical protein